MLRFVPEEAALTIETKESKILVVPDLHLGFEKVLADRGINIPSQTDKIFERLAKLIQSYRPDSLIFLGDIKHGTSKILPHEWAEIPAFFERLLRLVGVISIIPGNHDGGLKPLLPAQVSLERAEGLIVRDGRKLISMIHGHAWPNPEAFSSNFLIMGHHHFTFSLFDPSGLRFQQPIWLTCSWNRRRIADSYLKYKKIGPSSNPLRRFERTFGYAVGEPKIIVMPTFNPMLGGASINIQRDHEHLGPFFKPGLMKLDSSEVYMLDGTYLGKLSLLLRRVRASAGIS